MIVLITGASHTGKTALAQKLLEKYKYPYLSLDLLKMGLIRSNNTQLTPEDDDRLVGYLWPIAREMIKTAIENRQNLIVEGCYIPEDWRKDFDSEYLVQIRSYCLIMTERYIHNHFSDIKQYAGIIENRLDDGYCTEEFLLSENRRYLEQCRINNDFCIWIDDSYQVAIDLDIVAESERLVYRKMSEQDFKEVAEMLQDLEVMYAWEHAFSEEEVFDWIKRRKEGYQKNGFDYFLAVDKTSGKVVGQIGLLDEVIEGKHEAGLGYILKKEFWHQGYASEGAEAMMKYAFNGLGKKKVIAEIRPENSASCKVAEHLGMKVTDKFVKHYKGKQMIHLIYEKKKSE